jgi:HSP20 family molecular chaperone IbpA
MHRGRFHRTFTLPEPIDRNRIQWELKDGVLNVVLPKSSQTKNRLQGDSR